MNLIIWYKSAAILFDLTSFHSSFSCLLRRIWWSPPSPHLSSPPLSIQRHPLWPPPSQSIHHHFPPPSPCSVTPPLPLPRLSLTIHPPQPPQPSLQPPSCVLLLGQSEPHRDQFSSHRTNDIRVWVKTEGFNLTDASRLYHALTCSPSPVFVLRWNCFKQTTDLKPVRTEAEILTQTFLTNTSKKWLLKRRRFRPRL